MTAPQTMYTETTISRRDTRANMTDVTKEELSALLLKVSEDRDRVAFERLFRFFGPKIRSYGAKHLRADGQAMELVQETMLVVWRKAHLYNADKGAATTWVFTIMRNISFDMLRKVQSNREDNFSDDIWPVLESGQQDNESDAGAQYMMDQELLSFIDELPDVQQQVVRGVYLKQLTHQELSEQLNVPLGTVKSRLRLGLEKLRNHLEVKQ
ncbi:RNA polymerase subunit sigma [Salinivibrio sp. ML198]|uniref:RNA polymerase subunit sigma n=2 Tax=Vibrionaceae TaxID=641 RepID=A0ABX3K7I0_9GAMM|nr:sigma-70 family RNA polymerase sigma factor [Salinivibrio siamensis]OOE65957.1 RNA polymerase subunit sigma [Salinivibrio sp. IB868]OOE73043.1 RNA polymerase subunit sigma [Salinivibrio sp. ML290]OOE76736.1 RNA polymerase subunit sigma [Salinivibrio sp. IB870]OOE78251.1 RNA polymerase subunit sigma [Salinivibrio sp. ML198]OOE83822.1 RNA polymerase subunit sigma [Salinivibrio siamensis]